MFQQDISNDQPQLKCQSSSYKSHNAHKSLLCKQSSGLVYVYINNILNVKKKIPNLDLKSMWQIPGTVCLCLKHISR